MTQEQASRSFEKQLKEAGKRRRLESREDRLAAKREEMRQMKAKLREEEEEGGFGPKAQAALDAVNNRMDGIESTLTTLLYEVQSQSRARKFFNAARR